MLEVTTSHLQGKFGAEIRIESLNKDHSHSWVRIFHGLNKLVTDLSNKEDDNNEQETSEIQFEDCALQTTVLAFASRSQAKAKPHRRISASSSTKTIPIGERTWTDIEPQDYSSFDYPVSKQLSTLLRHGDRQYFLRLWVLSTRNTKIRITMTWTHHVLHGTSRKSGRNIKTQCIGSTSNLLKRKDLFFIKHDRTPSSFTTHC